MTRKVLVVGGSGVFGARLVDGILATSDLDMVVAGRHPGRLEAFIAARDPVHRSRLSAAFVDTTIVTADDLLATGAFAVVDTSGPYQGRDFRLARAAIEAGMHYLDLADARDFVGGIAVLDEAARAADVAVLSGASSTPALSNAVLDELVKGWRQVDHVRILISPGNRAPRGLSVVRSILSYAGRPVRVFLDGAWRDAPGWGMTRRVQIAGLGRRWAALCDTPDLDIIPARFRVRRSSLFQAGLELSIMHLGLLAVSLLVRVGLLRTLAPWAALVRRVAGLLKWAGTGRGAMVVEAHGLDGEGHRVRAGWTMIAEAGDGPQVPTLPALAVVKALADGRLTWRGAGPCVGMVQLEDVEHEFRRFCITTTREASRPGDVSLFRAALGPGFDRLPAAVRAVHEPGWGMTLEGRGRVDGPSSVVAALVARSFGLPSAGDNVPVRVDLDVDEFGERWMRDFGGPRFVSRLKRATAPGHVTERFGPFSFDVALTATGGVLRWDAVAWRVGWVPLPRPLMPVASAEESAGVDGRFHFEVSVCLPLGLGRLVCYLGSLEKALVQSGRGLQHGYLPCRARSDDAGYEHWAA